MTVAKPTAMADRKKCNGKSEEYQRGCNFWGTIKNELIYHCRYSTRKEAIQEITEYIEIFYNRQRRQKRLGYLSPAAYERQYYAGKIAA